jgi:DNA-binding transcriptional MerR regulator/methylmalonyl-CoA mutase cobalamin-binding subunit
MTVTKAVGDALPVRTVARLTGLTPDLIRAWERRYAAVAPRRGPRGARLYSASDVARLRLLQRVVAGGRAIGDVAKLGTAELTRLVDLGAGDDARLRAPGDDGTALRDALAALAQFDAAALDRCLSDALIGLGASEFCRRVAAPLLEEVGRGWADNRLSIADEHLLSASLRNLLAGVMRMRGAPRGPGVLLATPSGERHEFGLLLAALAIADAGCAPWYLGTDLPADQIIAAARRAQAMVVGLGIVNAPSDGIMEEVRRVERGLPAATELWLGGAQAPALVRQLGRSRALVVQDLAAVERELERIRTPPHRGG